MNSVGVGEGDGVGLGVGVGVGVGDGVTVGDGVNVAVGCGVAVGSGLFGLAQAAIANPTSSRATPVSITRMVSRLPPLRRFAVTILRRRQHDAGAGCPGVIKSYAIWSVDQLSGMPSSSDTQVSVSWVSD